jgi:hypothetical protein
MMQPKAIPRITKTNILRTGGQFRSLHAQVLFFRLYSFSRALPIDAQEKSAPTIHTTYYVAADEVERNYTR